MSETETPMSVDDAKRLLCLRFDRELAEFLEVHHNAVSRWRSEGIPKAHITTIELHVLRQQVAATQAQG